MFDDPVRIANLDAKETTETLDFTKSGKGLGDIYGDEYAKKLNKLNPEVFASTDENAALKKEIESLFTNVIQSLNTLSHIHYAPKAATKKTDIRSQNVPAIQLEEAVPITVSHSQTVNLKRVKVQENKEELSKEEKRRLRAKNKRHLKSKLKHKELGKKEKMRAEGVANVGDRFLHKEIQTKIEA